MDCAVHQPVAYRYFVGALNLDDKLCAIREDNQHVHCAGSKLVVTWHFYFQLPALLVAAPLHRFLPRTGAAMPTLEQV